MPASPHTRVLREEGETRLVLPAVRLTVISGADKGRESIAHRGVLRVGTAPDNDLVLTDDAVSRRHAEFRLKPDEVRIEDLGSTNGTFVNGVRILKAILSSDSLVRVGSSTLRATRVEDAVRIPLSAKTSFGGLLGRSVAMRAVFSVLERAAPTDATVLIEGETGTGKELAAEALHQHSERANGPFVTVDCSALAPNLMESELFGHLRGAFTGASSDRRGVFEEANGGTIFLDEIGELPLELQPKLLRALDNREVRPLGGSHTRRVDVRVVAATNRDLASEVNAGRFREDLYYRLAVVRVEMPALRHRPEDIPLLLRHFVGRFAPDLPVSQSLIDSLSGRSWPGNVRALRNAVEHALAMSSVEVGATSCIPKGAAGSASFAEVIRPFLELPAKEAQLRWIELFEQAYWKQALQRSGGSVSGAARKCGVNRRYVQRALKRLSFRDNEEIEPE